MTEDLAAFLTARLDEMEAKAQAATPGTWSADPTGTVCADADLEPDGNGGEILPSDGPSEVAECYRNERPGERGHNAEHIAANDPQLVLADVAAKRRIVNEYGVAERLAVEQAPSWAEKSRRTQRAADLLDVVRLLAAPFAGHPEFRDEWRVA